MRQVKNRGEYEELAEKIKKCLKWYERKGFDNIIHNLALADGKRLEISFGKNNIAHLLGIDTEYLKSTGLYKGSSYSILNEIINNPYQLCNLVANGHLKYSSFISEFAFEKADSFYTICGIDDFSKIEFVVNYNMENSYITGYNKLEGDYYISYNNGGKEFIIGLKKDGRYYVPITNRHIDLSDESQVTFLHQLLKKQIITMPMYSSRYYLNDYIESKKYYTLYRDKAKKFSILSHYSDEYGAIIDVSRDYYYTCSKYYNLMDYKESESPIYIEMFKYISQRVKINVSKLEKKFGILPDNIMKLINMYNSTLNESIQKGIDEYTREVTNERDRLKKERERHVEELNALKKEILQYQTQISSLEGEKAVMEEKIRAVQRILK